EIGGSNTCRPTSHDDHIVNLTHHPLLCVESDNKDISKLPIINERIAQLLQNGTPEKGKGVRGFQ
ncbi:MAG TPA: hypothetical protein VES58_09960, partial [Syntrophobacteria bacterium]|nr:hypothetical protein [Syntrophobacteria bacterium]